MTEFLIALVVVNVVCALVIAIGGLRGREAANPWWAIMALVGVVVTFHVLGFYFPEATWVSWAGLAAALLGGVPATLREQELARRGVMPDFLEQDRFVDIIMFFIAFGGARVLQGFLPEQPVVTLVIIAFVPLLLLRWTVVRLVPLKKAGKAKDNS
jgi:hypothetical protein